MDAHCCHRCHYTCNQWLEETDCFLAIKAREQKVIGGGRKRQNQGVRRRETEPGKILVHQPAAPRAFTTIVSVLDGEDRTEN